MPENLKLDIISDTICPWCYIGKKRLDEALARFGSDRVDVMWRPYQLDPTVPKDGIDRRGYIKNKFGDPGQRAAMLDALNAAGDAQGIAFDFDAIDRTPNTMDSHRLIRWASNNARQQIVVELLFKRYFEEGADIGQNRVLIEVAAQAGMDSQLVTELLQGDSDLELVQTEIDLARHMGVTGVPTFIIENRYAVVGAQDSDVLFDFLQQSVERLKNELEIAN